MSVLSRPAGHFCCVCCLLFAQPYLARTSRKGFARIRCTACTGLQNPSLTLSWPVSTTQRLLRAEGQSRRARPAAGVSLLGSHSRIYILWRSSSSACEVRAPGLFHGCAFVSAARSDRATASQGSGDWRFCACVLLRRQCRYEEGALPAVVWLFLSRGAFEDDCQEPNTPYALSSVAEAGRPAQPRAPAGQLSETGLHRPCTRKGGASRAAAPAAAAAAATAASVAVRASRERERPCQGCRCRLCR